MLGKRRLAGNYPAAYRSSLAMTPRTSAPGQRWCGNAAGSARRSASIQTVKRFPTTGHRGSRRSSAGPEHQTHRSANRECQCPIRAPGCSAPKSGCVRAPNQVACATSLTHRRAHAGRCSLWIYYPAATARSSSRNGSSTESSAPSSFGTRRSSNRLSLSSFTTITWSFECKSIPHYTDRGSRLQIWSALPL